MTKCVSCQKNINSIGAIQTAFKSTIFLFVCFNKGCHNFCLTQVELGQFEDEEMCPGCGKILEEKEK